MLARHALSAGATLLLLLLGGCASRQGRDAQRPYLAGTSGSASARGSHAVHAHEAEHAHDHAARGGKFSAEPGRHLWHRGHGDVHDGHGHDHAPRRLLHTDLRRGWCAPTEHVHVSGCGTPYVHGFGTEPAFLGRDVFLDASRSGDETEVEAEIEWSLTRRLGVIAELPYIDAEDSGFGDAGIGLRALLVEEPRFLLSTSAEVEIPTGSERRGLGSGNVALGANLHTWLDLGSWVTLQTQLGIEHVPDEGESEFGWSATLAKSFRANPLIRTCRSGHDDHGPTAFSLLAEIHGLTALSGDTGATEGRWLLGASYPLTWRVDLRAAFSRSYGSDEDDEAWTLGFIFHL